MKEFSAFYDSVVQKVLLNLGGARTQLEFNQWPLLISYIEGEKSRAQKSYNKQQWHVSPSLERITAR